MSNRREFLQGCTAVAGLIATSNLFAEVSASTGWLVPTRAIFDDGFNEGQSFARAARDFGMATNAISGDVTRLWYGDLYYQWQHGPLVMAGMTGKSALFCLEQLARDAGHSVVLRVDHARAADGSVSHRFQGPADLLDYADLVVRRDPPDWGASMANLSISCPARSAVRESRMLATGSRSPLPWSESLVSWVIAPKRFA